MRLSIVFVALFVVLMSACSGGEGAPAVEDKINFSVSDKTRKKATDIGKIPTSIEVNFKSGYWHIASGFNVDSLGDFRPYEGIWLDMRENNEFLWGVKGEERGMGAWAWDEPNQYLYFFADSNAEFFIGEWATNNNGDVVVCVGSTPNNPRSTQFKLVRRHEKIITE